MRVDRFAGVDSGFRLVCAIALDGNTLCRSQLGRGGSLTCHSTTHAGFPISAFFPLPSADVSSLSPLISSANPLRGSAC